MDKFRLQSPAEQVADFLRQELFRGRWGGTIPGMGRIAKDLGLNHKTVMAAMRLLEQEGVLVSQGPGRQRKVVLPTAPNAFLRVAWLMYDLESLTEERTGALRQEIDRLGHTVINPRQTLTEMNMEVSKVRDLVRQTEADAWIVVAGSRDILSWFAAQEIPAFALYGRRRDIPIAAAGPDKPPVIAEATNYLLKAGHRRIAYICRQERRLPIPGSSETAFLETLEEHGIRTGKFNLPDWEESPQGLRAILTSLTAHTPPTALVVDEASVFFAVMQFLGQHGLHVPRDISMVCTDYSSTFTWCEPAITHIDWDFDPVMRRAIEWLRNTARGRKDVRQTLTPAKFIQGGTVAEARRSP